MDGISRGSRSPYLAGFFCGSSKAISGFQTFQTALPRFLITGPNSNHKRIAVIDDFT
jgi:hypothetical protein